jgi:cytochrome b subunit of formate dehydrogenase
VFFAANSVLPDQAVKSKISSHSFEYVFIRYSISATGFWVGCSQPCVLILNTLLGFLFAVSGIISWSTFFSQYTSIVFHQLFLLYLFLDFHASEYSSFIG